MPVYLYEAAARRPDRVNLENIRRGQFEGVREEVRTNPDRRPITARPNCTRAPERTVVGARKFLIAYNINLNTSDLDIAKRIAKAIRFSSGGFRYVKSMGVPLASRNLAQVSMNLTDFEQTPIHRVFETVRAEAARYGASIVGSEIVGLIPKRALEMTAEWYLQVENFQPSLVLENRLAEATQIGWFKRISGRTCRPYCNSRRRQCRSSRGGHGGVAGSHGIRARQGAARRLRDRSQVLR